MSCEQRPGQVAGLMSRLSAGINALVSKRSFYVGLGLAGSGAAVAGLVTAARRARPTQSATGLKRAINIRDIPQLPSRLTVKPTLPRPGQPCAECGTSGQSKAGPWYRIGNRAYCRDCAGQAADRTGVDLVRPEPDRSQPTGAAGHSTYASYWQPLEPGAAARPVEPLAPEQRVPTKLIDSRVRVRLGESRDGPLWGIVENAAVVVDRRGFDTGLALTPMIKKLGDGALQEDPSRWRITHISSGKALENIYGSRQEAHMMASILAQIDWTRPEAELTTEDLRRASVTQQAYRQAVKEAAVGDNGAKSNSIPTRPGADSMPGAPNETTSPQKSGLSLTADLTGRLIANDLGGISRVLTDNGNALFACDSLGNRYEVRRDQIRLPGDRDYEMSRVARAINPAQQRAAVCTTCQQPAQGVGPESWYKMGGKLFCPSCSQTYAAQEAYIMEEEVGDLLDR